MAVWQRTLEDGPLLQKLSMEQNESFQMYLLQIEELIVVHGSKEAFFVVSNLDTAPVAGGVRPAEVPPWTRLRTLASFCLLKTALAFFVTDNSTYGDCCEQVEVTDDAFCLHRRSGAARWPTEHIRDSSHSTED